MDRPRPLARRRNFLYGLYGLIWLAGSVGIGIPVLNGLWAVLDLLSPEIRIVFYLMPVLLSGLLVLGVLQIISMYRYWFGPR
jgi:hypothetical protein